MSLTTQSPAAKKTIWRAKRSTDPVIRANDLADERTRDAARRAVDADDPQRLAAERTRDAARRAFCNKHSL